MVTKAKKQRMLKTYISAIDNYLAMFFVDAKGVPSNDVTKLKKQLKKKNANFLMVKNTIYKLAMKEVLGENFDEGLSGQLGVIITKDNVVEVAKLLGEYTKRSKLLTPAFGYLGENKIDGDRIKQLADLPNREQLLGQVTGTMIGVLRGFMTVLGGSARDFTYLLNARSGSLKE